jgi:hypothetical protein
MRQSWHHTHRRSGPSPLAVDPLLRRQGAWRIHTTGAPLDRWIAAGTSSTAARSGSSSPLGNWPRSTTNGMAFSPSVEERTPSTAITKDGLGWVDFSARSRHPDGKHDGGDTLELVARRNGETRTNKRGTMQEAARALVREAKAALEEAARACMPSPPWVASIMTEAGWKYYQRLCNAECMQTQATASSSKRDSGVHQTTVTNEAPLPTAEGRVHPANAPSSAPHDAKQRRDSLEALAAEFGAEIATPCQRCGCIFYYQSGPYRMCHWCLPRPARFGRLSDEQRARLRALFPCKRAWGA